MNLFFFNDTATTEIYTLSLHDALPIWTSSSAAPLKEKYNPKTVLKIRIVIIIEESRGFLKRERSEEHTSELQSRQYLVCRLLLEKKKNILSPLILLPILFTI